MDSPKTSPRQLCRQFRFCIAILWSLKKKKTPNQYQFLLNKKEKEKKIGTIFFIYFFHSEDDIVTFNRNRIPIVSNWIQIDISKNFFFNQLAKSEKLELKRIGSKILTSYQKLELNQLEANY